MLEVAGNKLSAAKKLQSSREKSLVAKLSASRQIESVKTREKINIDGTLNETAWKHTPSNLPMLVYPGFKTTAKAYTGIHSLYNDKNLYFGMTCINPPDKVPEKDAAEIFLQSPQMKGGYVHITFHRNGAVKQQRGVMRSDGGKGFVAYSRKIWKCPGLQYRVSRNSSGWTLECKIPFASLDNSKPAGNWKINAARAYRLSGKRSELSCIMQPGAKSFHQAGNFVKFHYSCIPNIFAPVSIDPVKVSLANHVFADRVATMVEITTGIKTARPLTNCTLSASLYDDSGKLHASNVIAEYPVVFPEIRGSKPHALSYSNICEKGGMLLKLDSGQGTFRRWLRFGGWEGAGKTGNIIGKKEFFGKTVDVLRGGFYFPSFVTGKGAGPVFGEKSGTVEFWFYLPGMSGNIVAAKLEKCFLQYGPVRPKHPEHTNNSPLAIVYCPDTGMITFSMKNRKYAGWSRNTVVKSAGWHHLACVWGENGMRMFLDGKESKRKVRMVNKKRLKAGVRPYVDNNKRYNIQVGCFTSGYGMADMPVALLRISPAARYYKDFIPDLQSTVRSDNNTTVLFDFNNGLNGKPLPVKGIAGFKYQDDNKRKRRGKK